MDQANKEVSTRYDFKGSDARIENSEKVLTLFADAEFQLDQVKDILLGKLAKRGIDIRCLEYGKLEKVSGNKVKQSITVREGIETELAKKIVRMLPLLWMAMAGGQRSVCCHALLDISAAWMLRVKL